MPPKRRAMKRQAPAPMRRAMKRRSMKRGGAVRRRPAAAAADDDGVTLPRKKRSVEQTYQKKTQIEHILLRPDTYVGSVEWQQDQLWVWDEKKGEMQWRNISYVPALYKIFDEILVNAADNLQRDPKMNAIKVDIDAKKGKVRVWNNGKGLPIQIHKKHKVFVPELVFGHLLTSDNYDDSERKVTGGRNGFGAKLTNIFSRQFIIETGDRGKTYKQDWSNNMSKKGKATIKKSSSPSFTCVEFWPDFKKFGMENLDADTLALMQRRVYDVAGTSGERCTVHLNGKKLPVKSFSDYCALFHSGEGYASMQNGKRWEVLVSKSDGDGFQQNSFVNAISTPKGGTHVQYIVDQLIDAIIARAAKLHKGVEVKRVHVRTHLWIFINCLIENPAFSSQTKEQMTLKGSKFGSTCNLSNSFIAEVIEQTGIVDAVVAEASAKMTLAMDSQTKTGSRSGKRVLGIPKLEDANDAGGPDSKHCTLIITEGDSAKALAVAGLAVVGRDRYGVFPLRGKPLNVRDVVQRQVMENKEIMNLVKILGLSFDRSNRSEQNMRYGHVMIMADQDYDGSHIKGLLINLFHHWWPHLLTRGTGFIQEFVTPIVKVTKGQDVKQFFTQTEYEQWKAKNDSGRGWRLKYYKGLGTSTSAEAKEYFKAIEHHQLDFRWKSATDGKCIDMAFNKQKADERKKWMNQYKEGTFVDHSKATLTYQDFVNLELVQFSRYDLMRSVPSVMDGLKPTQRKILYCCFKRNLRNDCKVAQLVGYVAEHSAYHHGEQSLAGSIVAMAQDFVGSNNLNLLVPSGQFGTRLQGGKDAASTRYIYTRLHQLARLIFSPLDDPVLDYLDEEGQRIEPYWYCPVIPLVLVNGAEGIGTGWATSIPNYDPREIIANLRLFLRRKKMKPMRPWYRGFTGSIKPASEKGKYDSVGVWSEISRGSGIEITELPLKKWTQDYKEFLQTLLPGSDKRTKVQVADMKEYHTEDKCHFVLRLSTADVKKVKEDGVESFFRLKTTISETNMVLFDSDGRIKRYKNAVEILEEFAKVRLKYYDVRKKYLVEKLSLERELLANRARFIGMIIAKKLHINNRKKLEVVKDLVKFKFRRFGDSHAPRTGYEYLLVMHIVSLTLEKKQELEKLLAQRTQELNQLKRTTIQQMWSADLDALEAGISQAYSATDTATEGPGSRKRPRSGLKLWAGAKGRGGRKGGRGRGGRRSGRGRGRGRYAEEEVEEEEAEAAPAEGEAAPFAQDEVFGTPAGDVSRWTAGALRAPGGSARRGRGAAKRRRM